LLYIEAPSNTSRDPFILQNLKKAGTLFLMTGFAASAVCKEAGPVVLEEIGL
jgi:hypothetical protein